MVAEEIIVSEKIELSQIGRNALVLVSEYLGKYASDIYRNFYQGKDDTMILESVNELLGEVVGENKASQLMGDKFGGLYENKQ